MELEFRLLGPLELSRGSRPVRLRGPKQRALLAALLLRANRVADTDYLFDVLWGGSIPPSAKVTLHSHVMRVRAAISGNGRRDDVTTRITTCPSGYLLVARPSELDLDRFDQEVTSAAAASTAAAFATAATRYRRALAIWRGSPLADVPSDRLQQIDVPQLEQRRFAALQDCIDAELALGRHGELIAELHTLVREHPYLERLVGQLMLALYRSGQQVDALNVYQRTAKRLGEELGLRPGPELTGLHNRILNHDPILCNPAGHASPSSLLGKAVEVHTGN